MADKAKYTVTKVVTAQMTAMAVGSGTLPVLSTPSMITLMESAAAGAASELAGPGQTTVGVILNIAHKRPVPIGQRVTATAEIIATGKEGITFRVTLTDGKGIVGEGEHVRRIVDVEKFISRM